MQPSYSWAWVEAQVAQTTIVWNDGAGRPAPRARRYSSKDQQNRENAYDEGFRAVEREVKRAPRAKRERLETQDRIVATFARFSAVADYLELYALSRSGLVVREPDLERRFENDGVRISSPLDQTIPDATRAASIVFDVLLERARILGDLYPFIVSRQEGLSARRPRRIRTYRVLLALTTAHAFHVSKKPDPKKLFEGLVERTLRRLGLRTTTTGTSRKRGRGGFQAVLQTACTDVGLKASVDGVILSRAAKDENVDTLAHLDFQDQRRGRWTFIGQATVGESSNWEAKAKEPSPKVWQDLIADTHRPSVFLAVPHHVEPLHLESMHQREDAIVLDRLRLALQDVAPEATERELVSAVDACQVDW